MQVASGQVSTFVDNRKRMMAKSCLVQVKELPEVESIEVSKD